MTGNIEKNRKTKKTILALSVGLFIFSLTQKCYCTTSQCGDSIAVFLFGWLGMFSGGATFTWLANPLIILSWFLTGRSSKYGLALGIWGTLFCLSFLLFDSIIDNEAGTYKQIISYKIGYWLWTASAITMLVGNLILRRNAQIRNAG